MYREESRDNQGMLFCSTTIVQCCVKNTLSVSPSRFIWAGRTRESTSGMDPETDYHALREAGPRATALE